MDYRATVINCSYEDYIKAQKIIHNLIHTLVLKHGEKAISLFYL